MGGRFLCVALKKSGRKRAEYTSRKTSAVCVCVCVSSSSRDCAI